MFAAAKNRHCSAADRGNVNVHFFDLPRVPAKCYMSLKRKKTSHRARAPPAGASSTSVPELPGGAGLVWRWAAGAAADAGGGRRGGSPPTRLGIGLGLGFGVWASGFGASGLLGSISIAGDLRKEVGRREARWWRWIAGRGGRRRVCRRPGWRLDKRWARDRGGGDDNLPLVTSSRISTRGVAAAGFGSGSRQRRGRRAPRQTRGRGESRGGRRCGLQRRDANLSLKRHLTAPRVPRFSAGRGDILPFRTQMTAAAVEHPVAGLSLRRGRR
jgi:hypothetical protein